MLQLGKRSLDFAADHDKLVIITTSTVPSCFLPESAAQRSSDKLFGRWVPARIRHQNNDNVQHPPTRDPKYHLIETIRPLIEVHWGV